MGSLLSRSADVVSDPSLFATPYNPEEDDLHSVASKAKSYDYVIVGGGMFDSCVQFL